MSASEVVEELIMGKSGGLRLMSGWASQVGGSDSTHGYATYGQHAVVDRRPFLSVAKATNVTASPSYFGGIVLMTGTSSCTLTLPTPAVLEAYWGPQPAGTIMETMIVNTDTNNVTLAGATGMVLKQAATGLHVVDNNDIATLRVVKKLDGNWDAWLTSCVPET